MKSNDVKEAIINTTIGLIEENAGNLSKVTARQIASGAGVSLGLINYHFGNKDNLILECTQSIISGVVGSYKTEFTSGLDAKERLKITAKNVFEFLFSNPAISRISILGDLTAPGMTNNSMGTAQGFMRVMGDEIPQRERQLIATILVSAMQEAFLYKEVKPYCGEFDLSEREDREAFIEALVESLF